MATIDQSVADVVAIIGRDKARIDKIEEEVTLILNQPNYGPWNKKDKLVARSLADALNRLDRVLNRRDVRELSNRLLIEYEGVLLDLREFRSEIEELVHLPLGQPKPSAARFKRKREAVAVAVAAKILDAHSLPRTVTRKSDKRKASIFCRVAAVLYGDKGADLSHQCRAYNEARNRDSK